MVTIKILNSGSKGNMYSLKSNNSILIVEIGMPFSEIINNVELQKIVGAVYTHRHFDHRNPKTSEEFRRRGISVYAGENIASDGECVLYKNKRNKIGDWQIQIFDAPHNINNYGFLIQTPTNERILFLTDTTGVNLRFRDISCIMVEANHDDDTLLDNIDRHDASMSHPEWHMGLDECKEFCKQNIGASTKQVILIHLSHTNINEQHAIETIKDYCNFDNVAVAHKGDVFKIDNDDF